MAGRPPLPSNVHALHGNPGKRARNAHEPEPLHLQDLTPPEHLTEEQAKIWNELAPKLRRAHLLTELDTYLLEMTCEAMATYRLSVARTAGGKELQKNAETGSVSLSPWSMVKQMAFKRGMACLQQFGASPAWRSRVMVDPQQDLFAKGASTGTDDHFT